MEPTKQQLIDALRGVLPFAQIEVDCRVGYLRAFPGDPDGEPERTAEGVKAVEAAIAILEVWKPRRPYNLSEEGEQRRTQALREYWRKRNSEQPKGRKEGV